jgi:hypothetical protein
MNRDLPDLVAFCREFELRQPLDKAKIRLTSAIDHFLTSELTNVDSAGSARR